MKKLLMVEDDRILVRSFRRELSKRYNVTIVSSLEKALETIHLEDFDIVLTDMHLTPDQTAEGLKVLSFIKNNPNISAKYAMSSDSSMRERCLAMGAEKFFAKPFDLAVV